MLLLCRELYRHAELYTNRYVFFRARLPLPHLLQDTDCLGITLLVERTHDFEFIAIARRQYHKTNYTSSTHLSRLYALGQTEVVINQFQQGIITTWILRHSFIKYAHKVVGITSLCRYDTVVQFFLQSAGCIIICAKSRGCKHEYRCNDC